MPAVASSRCHATGSPVSDDGRGLKPPDLWAKIDANGGSPVSDDGRGLKLPWGNQPSRPPKGSPVSDDGRGLKRQIAERSLARLGARPSAMTGAD